MPPCSEKPAYCATPFDLLVGRREDVLVRVGGSLQVARRKIILDQSVLLAKNLTMFF
jgi:ethylbenzene dioxygenase beta subunit